MTQHTTTNSTYRLLLAYCANNDLKNAENQYHILLTKNASAIERFMGAKRMNEYYIRLRDYDSAAKTLQDLHYNIDLLRPKESDQYAPSSFKPGQEISFPFVGKIKVTRDTFESDDETKKLYRESYAKNLQEYYKRTAYAITQDIIISIYKGNLSGYKEGIKEFVELRPKINADEYDNLYARIEDAKIMDHLIKTSTLMQFPNDDEIGSLSSAEPVRSTDELLESYSKVIPAQLQYLLAGQEMLLLNVQNLLLLQTDSKNQSSTDKGNISVGKKVWRALRKTLFDRVCENKNLSKLVANGSVIGVLAPIFREAGITNLAVISTTVVAVTQYGIEFICNLKDQIIAGKK